MRVDHNKLVRDLIPQIIESNGHRPTIRILNEHDYQNALLAKLLEEAAEVRDAAADQLPEELADILEVVRALLSTLGTTWHDLLILADKKRNERGGFSQRLFLEYVDQTPQSLHPSDDND